MSFLNAQWKDLALINYEIDTQILQKYLPAGTELDIRNDKCYISLVGFLFKETKVLGIKIPYHVDFEEVNLRFYVKRFENGEWKRGVVFIKEIVPKNAITFIANTLYKEHYETRKMRHQITENESSKIFNYQWKVDGKWNTIKLKTGKDPKPIELDSEAEFITEHYFGYTKYSDNITFEYEVKHPRWKQLEVKNFMIKVDFERNYGSDFEILQNAKPVSVLLAKGSEIKVENKKTLRYEYQS